MDKGKRTPNKGKEGYRQTDSNSDSNQSSSSTLRTPKPLAQLRNNLNSILNRLGSDLQCEVLPSDEDTLQDLTDNPLNNITSSTTHSLTDDVSKSEEYSKKIPNTALQEENMAKAYRNDSKRNKIPTQSDLVGMKKTNNLSEIDNVVVSTNNMTSAPQSGRKGDEVAVSNRQRGGGDNGCMCNSHKDRNCEKQPVQKSNKVKCSCSPQSIDCDCFVESDVPPCTCYVKPTKELRTCKCDHKEPSVQPVEEYQCVCCKCGQEEVKAQQGEEFMCPCCQKQSPCKCGQKEPSLQPIEEYRCVWCQKPPPCKCGQKEPPVQPVEEYRCVCCQKPSPCKCGQKEPPVQPVEEYRCVCCQKPSPCKCGQTEGDRFVPVHVCPLEASQSSSDTCHLIADGSPCPCPKLSMKTRFLNALSLPKQAKNPQRNGSDIPTRLVFDLVEGIPEKEDSASDKEMDKKKKKKKKVEKQPRKAKVKAEEFYINDPEKIDVYYFDHGNSGYYRTTDRPPHLMTGMLMEQTSYYATKFWAEVFGTLHLIISFFTAFLLQLVRFLLYSIFRPLFVGLFQMASDYFLKPVLTIFFNGIIQPFLILFYNIATSVRDMCEPIATTLGFFLTQLAIPVNAARLVEINNTTYVHQPRQASRCRPV